MPLNRPAPSGCLALAALLLLLALLPVFLADALLAALAKLGLSPQASLLAVTGIFLGSLVNIPVARVQRSQEESSLHVGLFGLPRRAWGSPCRPWSPLCWPWRAA